MDNQHKLIKGYRDLSADEIAAINTTKALAEEAGKVVAGFEAAPVDQRWVAIGKTHLQQGFMALVRAIARPDSF